MGKQEVINYVMETPNNPNGAVLRTLLNNVEGGTNLPEVTSEDNGKVLAVVDGQWNKAEPSSGSENGINIIPFFNDGYNKGFYKEDGDPQSANPYIFYTYDELKAMYDNGGLYTYYSYGGYPFLITKVDFMEGSPSWGVPDELLCRVVNVSISNGALIVHIVKIELDSSNNLSCSDEQYNSNQ